MQNHLNALSREVERIEHDQSMQTGLMVIALLLAGLTFLLGGRPAYIVFIVIAAIGLMMLEPAARKRALAEQIVTIEKYLLSAGYKLSWTVKKRRHDV